MSSETEVNGQITDAVTQSDVEILGAAPAQALATVYMTMGQAVGISIQNATLAQQQWYPVNEALTSQSVNLLFDTAPAATVRGTQELLSGNPLAQLIAQSQALLSTGQQMVKTAQTTPGPPPGASNGSSGIPGAGGPWS
jgi:hypothetical protein